RERALDLPEERGVVVDVLDVVDVHTGLLLERVERGVRLPFRVHVERHFREVQLLGQLLLDARRAFACFRPAAAAGGKDSGKRDRGPSNGCPFEQLPPGELVGHSDPSVESTTNVESGLHEVSLGAFSLTPGSLFWTYMLTLPALVSITYCVAPPTYAVSSSRPVRRFSSAWPMRIFSGRTPTATRPV